MVIERKIQHPSFEKEFGILTEKDRHLPLRVIKFGGTSVGNIPALERIPDIVSRRRRDGEPVAIVASAMNGITSLLEEFSVLTEREAFPQSGIVFKEVASKYRSIVNGLKLSQSRRIVLENSIENLLMGVLCASGQNIPYSQRSDLILSFGERMSVQIVQAICQENGLPAIVVESSELIVTDNNFGDANVDFIQSRVKTRSKINSLLSNGYIPIITGFFGATTDGKIATLGRNSSDYLAVLISYFLGGRYVDIIKDVDGVYNGDPKRDPSIVSNGPFRKLTYNKFFEIPDNNGKVVHSKASHLAQLSGIELYVGNGMEEGTIIFEPSQQEVERI